MALAARKIFSIERRLGLVDGAVPEDNDIGARRHAEVMQAIRELRATGPVADGGDETAAVSAPSPAGVTVDAEQLAEGRALKQELQQVHDAILETKQEIATLHGADLYESERAGVSDELGAIVSHTEQATEQILSAAEAIDNDATSLAAALKNSSNHDLACDIQERVVTVFEACNFQDLTGQRITKIVQTLRFVDERINKMMEIWGGIDAFRDVTPVARDDREGDKAMLNGPALEGDEDVTSQDDIDALFG